MRVLIATDSFKGSLPATAVAGAIARGISASGGDYTIIKMPVADGGEGTAGILLEALGGEEVSVAVTGPLGHKITATYGLLTDGTAVIEMAAAAGLPLVPVAERNPVHTTTLGVGQMIDHALTRGCRQFIIGLGGSATNDAGMGMLQALGYRFVDKQGHELAPVGASLTKVARIDRRQALPELRDCCFTAACDVDNPFYGPNGAAHVFARQKGAGDKEVLLLDRGLQNLATIIEQDLGIDFAAVPGTGAAGGLGGALYALLKAELNPGTDIVFSKTGLAAEIARADMVVTGEGRLDAQTARGKAPAAVARLAKAAGKPVIALAGSLGTGADQLYNEGVTAMFTIMSPGMTREEAMQPAVAARLLTARAKEVFGQMKEPG